MMLLKKYFFILFLGTMILSCSKDKTNHEDIKLLSYKTTHDGKVFNTTIFSYNSDNQVEEETSIKEDIISNEVFSTYRYVNTYNNKLLVKRESYSGGILNQTRLYNYVEDTIVSITSESNNVYRKNITKQNYYYDNKGRVIREIWTTDVFDIEEDSIKKYKGEYNYHYLSSDKILSIHTTGLGAYEDLYQVDKSIITPRCLYRTEQENRLSPLQCYGLKNNIRTQRSVDGDVIYFYESTFEYTLNKYGYPTKKVQVSKGKYSDNTYTSIFEYNK